MSVIRIAQLQLGDDAGFKAAFEIYQDALEPSEQRTKAELRAMFGSRDYRFFVARRDREIIAMSAAYMPAGCDFWLYEYAAVAPAERGRGIGAELFVATREWAGQNSIALVEVDADLSGDPRSEQARRLAFYARLGFRTLGGIDYQLPLRTNGMPPPMVLMALAPAEVDAVPLSDLTQWLRSIYVDVYAQSRDDPRIGQMVAGLGSAVPLRRLRDPDPATP